MRSALVTGGAGGIGEAICRRLAEDGFEVYVNYAHSEEKALKIAKEINGKAIRFDVSEKKRS